MTQPDLRSPRLKRREFLRIGGTAVATLSVGTFAFAVHQKWNGIRNVSAASARNAHWFLGSRATLEQRIERYFHYLEIDPAALSAYVADHARYRGRVSRFNHPGDTLFHNFLLSTDFFLNGEDQSRVIRYVAFYDPYVHPCWNPLRDARTSA